MVLGQLSTILIQKNKKLSSYLTPSTKVISIWVLDLSEGAKNKSRRKSLWLWIRQKILQKKKILKQNIKSISHKRKKTYCVLNTLHLSILHFKNTSKNKKAHHRQGENLCKYSSHKRFLSRIHNSIVRQKFQLKKIHKGFKRTFHQTRLIGTWKGQHHLCLEKCKLKSQLDTTKTAIIKMIPSFGENIEKWSFILF